MKTGPSCQQRTIGISLLLKMRGPIVCPSCRAQLRLSVRAGQMPLATIPIIFCLYLISLSRHLSLGTSLALWVLMVALMLSTHLFRVEGQE